MALLFIFIYGEHTLNQYGGWISTKQRERFYLPGFHQFTSQRQALHLNQLNFGVWHGYNELQYGSETKSDRIVFRLNLNPDTYMWFRLNFVNGYRFGVRLSRSTHFPCVTSTIREDGSFTDKNSFFCDLKSSNKVEIRILPDVILVFVDGTEIVRKSMISSESKKIAFRSSAGQVSIDDFTLYRGSQLDIQEDFSPRFSLKFKFVFVAFFTFLFCVFILSMARLEFKRIQFASMLFILLCVFSIGDIFFWIPAYHYSHRIEGREQQRMDSSSIEDMRRLLFKTIYRKLDLLTPNFPQKSEINLGQSFGFYVIYPERKIKFLSSNRIEKSDIEPSTTRLMFVGASQAWGVGASSIEKSIISHLHDQFESLTGNRLSTFAHASPGKSISEISNYYYDNKEIWKPDYLIIYSSLREDEDENQFRIEIVKMIRDAYANRITPVIVLEPEASSIQTNRIEMTRKVLIGIGKDLGVKVVDANKVAHSEEIYDSGFVWWDNSHFDDFGQAAIGRHLGRALKVIVNDRRSRSIQK